MMKRILFFSLVVVTLFSAFAPPPPPPPAPYIPPDPYNDIDNANYGIWPNVGQLVNEFGDSVPDVVFYTSDALPNAYFRMSGTFSLVLATADTTTGTDTLRRMDVTCVGPHALYPDPVVTTLRDHYMNFYLPHCGPGGATNVHAHGRVTYENMYPFIDEDIYSGARGQKIAWVVRPGGDPKDIQLLFEGQDSLGLDVYGNLKILLDGKWVVLPEAVAYQVNADNSTTPVNWTATYVVNNGQATVRFDFDTYDHAKPLVFLVGPPALGGGPTTYDEDGLCWSTYYGGNNWDQSFDMRADDSGNFYVAGSTQSTFLTFPGASGTTVTNADKVATLDKFDSGNHLLWCTYYGGQAGNSVTEGNALAIKGTTNPLIYMGGYTKAHDLYTLPETGAYPNDGTSTNSLYKGFIAKFDALGQILWSTYFGEYDVAIQGMDIVGTDQLVISGYAPNNLPSPPTPLPGAANYPYAGGLHDGFIAMFDANDQLVWRTFYGGNDNDNGLNVRSAYGKIVLAGNTWSSNIPLLTPTNAYPQAYEGGGDVYIAEFNTMGVKQWASYLGGDSLDQLGLKGLAVSPQDGDIYLTGISETAATTNLPMVHVTGWYDDVPYPAINMLNGFIARFDGTDRSAKWITYLGSGNFHYPMAIQLALNGGLVYVAGYTNDADFSPLEDYGWYYQPTYNPNVGGDEDGFIVSFKTSTQARVWSSLFGGDAGPDALAERISSIMPTTTSVYVTGWTSKGNNAASYFPLDDAQQTDVWFNPLYNYNGLYGGFRDGFITQFCYESITTGIEEAPETHHGFHAFSPEPGEVSLIGLTDGIHSVRIYDPEGRVVAQQQVHSHAGHSSLLPVGDQPAALYLIVVDAAQVAKWVPVH